MKNQPGIDLADLSEAQRKMCVKLLALNNVEFIQNKDSYTATLSVPTSQVQSYLVNAKTSTKVDKKDKQNEQQSLLKQKNKNTQAQKSSTTMATLSPKPITRTNTNSNISAKPKSSKKPLFKATKLNSIAALETLHPQVQIYVHAKKLPISSLQEQIQWVYELCWSSRNCDIIAENKLREISLKPKLDQNNEYNNLVKLYYETASQLLTTLPNLNNNINNNNNNNSNVGVVKNAKNQQSLINSLQTINHYQHRDVGVRIFYKFLSNQYAQDQFSYFLVLRALMEEIMGEKIITIKSQSQSSIHNNNNNNNNNKKNSTFSNNSTVSIITFNNNNGQNKIGRVRLKWNPFQKQISEHTCRQFLNIVCTTSKPTNISMDSDRHTTVNNDASKLFQKLTQRMYYCQTKRGNFIQYCDLMEYLIQVFGQECSHYSVTNLEFSYSHNADSVSNHSILEGMFAHKSERPLQTVFEMHLKPIQQKQIRIDSKIHQDSPNDQSSALDPFINNPTTTVSKNTDEGNSMAKDLMNLTKEKCIKMCTNLEIPQSYHSQIQEKMQQCIESIVTMDKIKWVAAMGIQGNEKELNFIENLQKQYRQLMQTKIINSKNFNEKSGIKPAQFVNNDKISLGNMLLKRIFGGPGVMRLFNTKVQF